MQESFLSTSLTSRDCKFHPMYNPDKILRCEPSDECALVKQMTEHKQSCCVPSVSHYYSTDLLMYMAPSDRLARWIGRGSRITGGTMPQRPSCLRKEHNERTYSDWHPPLTYHMNLTKCNKQLLLQAATAVHHYEIHHCQHKLHWWHPSSSSLLAMFSVYSYFPFFASVISHKHLGKSISTSTCNVWP